MIWAVSNSAEAIILLFRIKVLYLPRNNPIYRIKLALLVKFHQFSKKLSRNLKNSHRRSKLYSVEMKSLHILIIHMAKKRKKIDRFPLSLGR
jgi:hypothetical protein